MSESATGILAIRPQPGLASTLALGRTLGLDIAGAPLFEVRAVPWDGPDPAEIDALLIGSANAFRHGGAGGAGGIARYSGKPVHAVGEATAQAAQDAGFNVMGIGRGGLQNVVDAVTPGTRLLRVAGAEHVALEVPSSLTIHTVIAYESVPLPLDPVMLQHAGDRPMVLLHSAAAARHFAAQCDRLGLPRGDIALAALGPRIANAAGEGWRAVHVSSQAEDRQLLELVREACI